MSEFEKIIEHLGAFGPYQVRVFLLVSAFETPAAWAMLLPIFAHAKPKWDCQHTEKILDNNRTAPSDSCMSDGSICYGANYTLEFTSIVSEWDLVCDKNYVGSLITTIQMVGVLVGACITGQLADTFGRRKVLFLVYALLQVFGLASSFANSWELYAAFRFFIGAFFGGTMVVNFVLPLEFVGRQWRTFCGCIGFWACGVMTQALLAYLIRDWRHLSFVCSVAGFPLLLTWWWIPESPRWLIQHGRLTEAERLLTNIAIFNQKTIPDFSKLRVCFKSEREMRLKSKKYIYTDLFRNISMTKNTLIMMYAWFVSSSVYYGTSLNVGHLAGDRYLNVFISGLVEIPALIFVVIVNNRLGRRKTLSLLMTVAGVSCLAILFVDLAGKLETIPILTTTLAMLGRSGIAGGWAAAQVFAAEVFPTVVRNIGVGACSMAARVGGIVAPQIVYLNMHSAPIPFLVFGGLSLLCGILAILLPETLNQPLPDTLPPCTLCSSCLPVTHTKAQSNSKHCIELETQANLVNGSAVNSETIEIQLSDVKHENDILIERTCT